jgi:ABC-2 type transport system permease protein
VAGLIALVGAIFPSIEGSADFGDVVEGYPKALKSLFGIGTNITTGPGFVDVELFSFMLPLLAIVLAIGAGARTLAGEEDAGRLELQFAYPVRRGAAVLAKGVGVGLEIAIFSLAALVVLELASIAFGMDLSLGRLAGAVVGVGLLGVLHGWLALALGAAKPSRALAIGIPAALATAAYLISGLHDLASWLDPLRFLSSFWWVGQNPVSDGVSGWGLIVVGLVSLAALGAAGVLIDRRDLETP